MAVAPYVSLFYEHHYVLDAIFALEQLSRLTLTSKD